MFIVGTIILNVSERRRQRRLATTRPAMDRAAFIFELQRAGADETTAKFVWDRVHPYYFEPLTPHPEDRLGSQFRIDPDDISEIAADYAEEFARKWDGEWRGPDDPTLAEFAVGLIDSTVPE